MAKSAKTTSSSKDVVASANVRLNGLEKQLNDVMVKNAPYQLPKALKEWMVKYAPWIALIVGIIGLWSAWTLWQLSRVTDSLVDYANSLSKTFGTPVPVAHSLNIFWYLALIVLVIQSVMQIAAFTGLREKRKNGWNWLFYSALLNVLTAVFYIFVDGRGVVSFIWSLIGTVIGLYFLFQIRSYYTSKKVVAAAK
jgi:hypothetical protein